MCLLVLPRAHGTATEHFPNSHVDLPTPSTSSATTPTTAPPTDPGGSTPTSISGKPFFDVFPREIRDSIYELTFDQKTTKGHSFTLQFQAPCLHLRLVSRQFKEEYDEPKPTKTTLVVKELSTRLQRIPSPQNDIEVPRLATRCTALHFTHDLQDLEVFRNWPRLYDRIRQRGNAFRRTFEEDLPLLRSVHIRVNLNFGQNFDAMCRRHNGLTGAAAHFRNAYLTTAREYFSEDNGSITIEFYHLGLQFPISPGPVVGRMPGQAALRHATTLVTSCLRRGHTVETFDVNRVMRRSNVEAAILTAWEAYHGCTLSASAKKYRH